MSFITKATAIVVTVAVYAVVAVTPVSAHNGKDSTCRKTSDAGTQCASDLANMRQNKPQFEQLNTNVNHNGKDSTCRKTSDAGTQCASDLAN